MVASGDTEGAAAAGIDARRAGAEIDCGPYLRLPSGGGNSTGLTAGLPGFGPNSITGGNPDTFSWAANFNHFHFGVASFNYVEAPLTVPEIAVHAGPNTAAPELTDN